MQTRLVRFIYDRRVVLKRLVFIHRPIRLTLRDFKMYVRLDDWSVGARIAVKRNYERHVTNTMRPLLRSGMTVIDIGANIGYYTLLAAARVGATGRVVAFEPSESNCALLEMSLSANGFKNVTLHTAAVADLDGVVGFSVDDSNGVISRNDPGSLPYQVRAVKRDTFLSDEPRVDLVKLDVEGAEGLALAGMQQMLARHQPIIFTEFSPHALRTTSRLMPEDYLNRLRDLEYELHVVHRASGQNASPQSNDEIMRNYEECQSDHLDLVAYPRTDAHARSRRT